MIDIDTLTPGREVNLRFYGSPDIGNLPYDESAVFLGITGSGEERRARFETVGEDDRLIEWEAYRFEGDWAYGTSAQLLRAIAEED